MLARELRGSDPAPIGKGVSAVVPSQLGPVPRGRFMRAFHSFIHRFMYSSPDLHSAPTVCGH